MRQSRCRLLLSDFQGHSFRSRSTLFRGHSDCDFAKPSFDTLEHCAGHLAVLGITGDNLQ